MLFFNPYYLLLLIPGFLAWKAQDQVRKVYEQYGEKPNRVGLNGMEAARRLLDHYGLTHVSVQKVPGHLTDHYDPQKKVLRLSDGVAGNSSVTSLGIVAHEVGHALQDAENYPFIRAHTFVAQRVSRLAQWGSVIFVGGMLFRITPLMILSGIFLAALLIFSLINLPLERNASNRALISLEQTGLAMGEEKDDVRRVLRSAAYTYLAGLSRQAGTFLFFVMMVGAAGR